MDGADSYSGGGGGGGGGGNDWEVVSLTASTYAAAPGPILPLLHHDKRESFPPAPAIFMSGHFTLPPTEADLDLLKQPDHYQEFNPAPIMGDDDTDPNMSCAKNCEGEMDDGLPCSAGEEQTTMFCSPEFDTPPDAGSVKHISARHASSATDGIVVDSAQLSCLTAHVPLASVAVSSGVACIAAKNQQPKIPCEGWWKKTLSFLCNNARESVTFRFIFVAATIVGLAILGQRDKSQLQQLRLQFNADSEKISCSVGEPLGRVKGGMIIGVTQQSPVAQG